MQGTLMDKMDPRKERLPLAAVVVLAAAYYNSDPNSQPASLLIDEYAHGVHAYGVHYIARRIEETNPRRYSLEIRRAGPRYFAEVEVVEFDEAELMLWGVGRT